SRDVLEDRYLLGREWRRGHAGEYHRGYELVAHGQRQHDVTLGSGAPHETALQSCVALDLVEDERLSIPRDGLVDHGVHRVPALGSQDYRQPLYVRVGALIPASRSTAQVSRDGPGSGGFMEHQRDHVNGSEGLHRG